MKDLTLYTQQCMKELHAIGIEFGNVLKLFRTLVLNVGGDSVNELLLVIS